MEFGWINVWGGMVVAIMLLPNILFAFQNPHRENRCKNKWMNLTEQVGRYTSMALMVLPVLVWKFGFQSVLEMLLYFGLTGMLLLAYLITWAFYFKSPTGQKAITLAALPALIFLVSGSLLRHWLLVISAILFGIGHIYVTLCNGPYRERNAYDRKNL